MESWNHLESGCLSLLACIHRSRSRSYSPSYSRRNGHGDDSGEISKPKIEYITEFGGSGDVGSPKFGGYSPPRSPPSQTDLFTRSEHSTSSSCKDSPLTPHLLVDEIFLLCRMNLDLITCDNKGEIRSLLSGTPFYN